MMIHDKTKVYDWDADATEHIEKSTDWYWALGIAVVVGSILCILSQNYLLMILLLLGGTMLGFSANDRPHHVHVEISEHGIKINGELYTFKKIQSFWMYKDHRDREQLLIMTGTAFVPQRIVSLPDDVPATDVRDYLLAFIEEKETHPSAIDTIAQTLGL